MEDVSPRRCLNKGLKEAAMAVKHSFSLLFIAIAMANVFGSASAGSILCLKADYPILCNSVVKSLANPQRATQSAIDKLIMATKHAKEVGARLGKSPSLSVCQEVYDDAISNLETSLNSLKTHDKFGLEINLSAALTDFVTCTDAMGESGASGASRISKTNALLQQMASNSLYLTKYVR